MRKSVYLRIVYFCLFLVVGGRSVSAATVAADLDKTRAKVREEIHLTIRIDNAQGNIQAPRIPEMTNFDVFYTGRASHVQFVNGVSSSSLEFSYTLIPQKAGSFSIKPIDIQVNGQSFRTETIAVTVLDTPQPAAPVRAPSPSFGGSASLPPQKAGLSQRGPAAPAATASRNEPSPDFTPDDDNIYVMASVNKNSAFPNEQILLTYSLYTRYDTRYEGFQEEPEVSGFWIEEFPMEQNVPRETVTVNGKRYIKAEVKKYALFPTAPADYTIKPGTLKASIRKDPRNSSVFDEFFDDSFFSGGSFFARREDVLLKPKPIHLLINPFPDSGKPKSFQGAVGNFRLTATLDKTSVKQDEPVTLKMVIEGEGNIETLNRPPLPELEGFRTYDADTNHQLFKSGDQIGGRKTFETVFIPTKPGRLVIPSIEFSYFNPAAQSYQVLKTQEYTLTVAKSDSTFTLPSQLSQNEDLKKDVESEKKDIRYIFERDVEREWNDRVNQMVLWLLVIDSLSLIFLFIYSLNQLRADQIEKNTALKRRVRAKSAAYKRMRKLPSLMKEKKEKETAFFDEVEKILTQYLTDKFNLSTLGITQAELEMKLSEVLGHEDALNQEIRNLFALCQYSRFAKMSAESDAKERAVRTLKETINRFEKIKL